MKESILLEKENISIDNIKEIAFFLKNILKNKDIIIMNGNLGFGKTTFIRELSNIMECEDIVSSPSFTIINEYNIILNNQKSILRHVDLYRLDSEEELDNIGFNDKIKEDGISFIEWGSKFINYFSKPYYIFEIEMKKEDSRLYRISLVK